MPGPTGLLLGGVRLDLAVRVDATRVFLNKIDAIGKESARAAVHRAGENFLREVYPFVAFRTGRMLRLCKVSFSANEFSFEGGWDARDFEAEGQPFYPPFVELGTSRQAAQPSIEPAYRVVAGQLQRDLAKTVQDSLTRATR